MTFTVLYCIVTMPHPTQLRLFWMRYWQPIAWLILRKINNIGKYNSIKLNKSKQLSIINTAGDPGWLNLQLLSPHGAVPYLNLGSKTNTSHWCHQEHHCQYQRSQL